MAENIILPERAIIIELLQMYRSFPCLWDLGDKNYKCKSARNQAYEILLKFLRKHEPFVTMEHLKKKLDNMRSGYKRERKKVEQNQIFGTMYIPGLWYFEYLSFLDEDPSPAQIKEELHDDDDEPHTSKRRRNDYSEESLVESTESSKHDDTSADSFGRMLADQLKPLTKIQRCLAEKLMSEVIFHAKTEKLTFNTRIQLQDSDSSD